MNYTIKTLLFLFLSLFTIGLMAQNEDLLYKDHVYLDNIKTTQLYRGENPLSFPIVSLNPINSEAPNYLRLEFDDLDGDVKDYVYTFIHCDHNWEPSAAITEMDYIDGYAEEVVDRYEYSYKTIQDYTHYELILPERDLTWKFSGNYLLVVYEDEDEKRPAISMRFMVMDEFLQPVLTSFRAVKADRVKTHHEMDFEIPLPDDVDIRNPQGEIRAIILQNDRWDTALMDIAPSFTGFGKIPFDYQNKLVFPAGKEFRGFDIRSLRTRSYGVAEIDSYDDGFDVYLSKDRDEQYQEYLQSEDLNGKFIIDILENDRYVPATSADYADVLFQLYQPEPYYDADIFVVGAFNNWELTQKNKMIYNPAVNGYVNKQLLKQGFYNYTYIMRPTKDAEKNGIEIDPNALEGNWYETENTYSILIYYRPFGSNYDQLVGYNRFSSRTPFFRLD